jgi:hypothetical protein
LQHLVFVFFRGYGALHRMRGYRIRCVQHLPCRTVGFLHVLIVSGADTEFALQTNHLPVRCKPLGLNQLRHTPVPYHPLQLENRMESTLQGLG